MSVPQYSQTFLGPGAAQRYEQFYEAGTADEALWKLERDFLAQFYERNAKNWPECQYLDFACGTGRVIAFLEDRPAASRGIDVSPEMLKIARTKVQKSELLCRDITKETELEGQYDLITAFRFFLNAEPSLRLEVLRALAARLKNDRSRLVFNNHGNPWSFKAIAWPVHRARQMWCGRAPAGNYLTHAEVRELVAQTNLRIVERTGFGIVSPRLFKFAPSFSARVESWAHHRAWARAAGVDQMYVVARR